MKTQVLVQAHLRKLGMDKLPNWVSKDLIQSVETRLKVIASEERDSCAKRMENRFQSFIQKTITRRKIARIIASGFESSGVKKADSEGRKGEETPLPQEGF